MLSDLQCTYHFGFVQFGSVQISQKKKTCVFPNPPEHSYILPIVHGGKKYAYICLNNTILHNKMIFAGIYYLQNILQMQLPCQLKEYSTLLCSKLSYFSTVSREGVIIMVMLLVI